MMIVHPQASPAALSAPGPVLGSDKPAAERLTPPRAARCAADPAEVVVCAPDQAAHRLRPLPPPPGGPGFFQRPHVIKLAPNIAIGLIGGGKGPGVRVEF